MGVRLNRADALEDVVGCLPYGWTPSRSDLVDALFSVVAGERNPNRARSTGAKLGRYHALYGGGTRLSRTLDYAHLLDRVTTEVRVHVAEHTTRRAFIHAGVVAWKGRAVVVPGRSFSGKTSLVRELVRLGATYYSDEFAVLDTRGRVHPFLKPLSLREPNRAEQVDVPVEALGGIAGTRPVPVGCVVVTEYKPNARWRPAILSPGRAALELFGNAVAARRNPAGVAAAVTGAVRDAVTVKSRRGEAAAVAEAILELMSRSST